MTSLWASVTMLGDGPVGLVGKKFSLMVNIGLLSVGGLICGFLFITPGRQGNARSTTITVMYTFN